MLELRPNCECCDVDLPAASTDARICTFECTFCVNCVEGVLANVCPNCGGGLSPRPIRSMAMLLKNPPSAKRVVKPLVGAQLEKHQAFLAQYKDMEPAKR